MIEAPALDGGAPRLDALCGRLRELSVNEDPDDVFQRWRRDARTAQLIMPDSAIISTSTRSGRVSARTVCFRRMDEGRFVFLTDSRSKKCRELAENPQAVITFFWAFLNEQKQQTAREVQVKGAVEPLAPEAYEDLYWSLIPNRRIRAYICEQGRQADWDFLKSRHDELLLEVDAGKELPMPSHFVAYEVLPSSMKFSERVGDEVADILKFTRLNEDSWELESRNL